MSLPNHQPKILRPVVPTDAIAFDELCIQYNFDNHSDRRRVFCNVIASEIANQGGNLLDIGCGSGMGEDELKFAYPMALREYCDRYIGIEPDRSVCPPPNIYDQIIHEPMETACLRPESFDLAYSHYVMEHVTNPATFLERVYACLKPGGKYIFITPNGASYFVIIAQLLKKWKLEEFVLRRVRGETVDDYHYPVVYDCNTCDSITKYAERAGFEPPQFAFLETYSGSSYFPPYGRFVWHMLMRKRQLVRDPNCLVGMIVRMTKPST